MYKFLILLFIVCSCTTQQGSTTTQVSQATKKEEITVLKTFVNGEWIEQEPDTPPSYTEGDMAMMRYLGKNVRYPAQAQRAGITGVALISAEVTEDGKLINEKIEKDLGGGIGQESLRVVKLFPDAWTPATLNGVPVRTLITIPVVFRIINSPQGGIR